MFLQVEVAQYHSKPVAYDFLWGSARVHHTIIPSLTPNMSIWGFQWNPRKDQLFNPDSVYMVNYAERERGGRANHLFYPDGAAGLLVDVDVFVSAVRTSVSLVSAHASNDVPVTPWRRLRR